MNNQKIVAGTAQLGFKYFHKEKITENRSKKILNTIYKNKIRILDTANGYGKSESYIGNFLKKNNVNFIICTKLKKSYSKSAAKLRSNIQLSIFESLNKLQVKNIDFYFIHHLIDLKKPVIKELFKFKQSKVLKNIGASIYTVNDYKKCLNFNLDILQIPLNFIDHRFLSVVKNDKKHKIFIRSVLLRGNINKNQLILPKSKKFKNLNKNLIKFKKKYKFDNFYDLNFSFIKSFKKISYVIIGFKNEKQIEIINHYKKIKPMNKKCLNELLKIVKKANIEKFIDLRNW